MQTGLGPKEYVSPSEILELLVLACSNNKEGKAFLWWHFGTSAAVNHQEVCNNRRKLFKTYWHWKEVNVYFNPAWLHFTLFYSSICKRECKLLT